MQRSQSKVMILRSISTVPLYRHELIRVYINYSDETRLRIGIKRHHQMSDWGVIRTVAGVRLVHRVIRVPDLFSGPVIARIACRSQRSVAPALAQPVPYWHPAERVLNGIHRPIRRRTYFVVTSETTQTG